MHGVLYMGIPRIFKITR